MKKRVCGILAVICAITMMATPVMASSLMDALTQIADQISQAGEDLANQIGDGTPVSEITIDGIDEIASEIAQAGEDMANQLGDAAQELAGELESAVNDFAQQAEEAVDSAVQTLEEGDDPLTGVWVARATQINDGELQNANSTFIAIRGNLYVGDEVIPYQVDGNTITVEDPELGEVSGTFERGNYEIVGYDTTNLQESGKNLLDADDNDGLILTLDLVDTSDPLVTKPYQQTFYLRRSVYFAEYADFFKYYLQGTTWKMDNGVQLTFSDASAEEQMVSTDTGMTGTWIQSNNISSDGELTCSLTIKWESSSTAYLIDFGSITNTSFTMSQKDDPSAVIHATLVTE